jgi:hypothetical protein
MAAPVPATAAVRKPALVGARAARRAFLVFSLAGVVLSSIFEFGGSLPVTASCLVFAATLTIGLGHLRLSKYSLLTRYVLALYSLPFIHSLEYVFNDISSFQNRTAIWGMTANAYEKDLRIIERMTLTGAIGVVALVAGMYLAGSVRWEHHTKVESGRRLRFRSIGIVAALALLLSWASAPKQTIFEAAYTKGVAPLDGTNFNAAYLLSYVFAAVLMIDAVLESRVHVRRYKAWFSGAVLVVIVIWFQFLRGDRECMGLVVAAAVLSFLGSSGLRQSFRDRKKQLMVAGGAVLTIVLVAQLVGTIRVGVVGKDVATAVRGGEISLIHGTWSGILLTDLSAVGDFERGRMSLRWGQTYIDYLLSLPPGPVAAALGYERPLEATRGPAWSMRYAQGGMHLMVIPFMNFHTPGVLLILMLFGCLIGRVEMTTANQQSVRVLLLYATVFIVGPLWIWYGDMLLVRGLMSYYAVWLVYRVLPKARKFSRHVPVPASEALAPVPGFSAL